MSVSRIDWFRKFNLKRELTHFLEDEFELILFGVCLHNTDRKIGNNLSFSLGIKKISLIPVFFKLKIFPFIWLELLHIYVASNKYAAYSFYCIKKNGITDLTVA